MTIPLDRGSTQNCLVVTKHLKTGTMLCPILQLEKPGVPMAPGFSNALWSTYIYLKDWLARQKEVTQEFCNKHSISPDSHP